MTMSDNGTNKRVAKNAIALTIRMVITSIIGLFTSRFVLQALGVDDYGIYGVVGGVIGLVSFLNASMSGATSRFITYEMGTGNEQNLKRIFSTALSIHLLIAVVVLIIGETLGLWFLNHKMVFPPDRMFAVNFLYQFTILTVFITFTQVPFSADIMAHERMNVYAYFEVANSILKLGIVGVLFLFSGERLIIYSILAFCVSLIIALGYRFYCIRNFSEAGFKLSWDKRYVKEMLAFSSFDMYGNMCVSAKSQGQPIILNIFFGVIANAGATIALTMSTTVANLTSSINQAFRPQIIKKYATGEISLMGEMMSRSISFTLLAYSILLIPFVIETPRILYLWLGQIPEFSVILVRIIMLGAICNIVINTTTAAIHSTGNIKNISFINGTFYLLSPILSYIILKLWIREVTVIYIVDIVMMSLVLSFGWLFLKKQIPGLPLKGYILNFVKCFVVLGVSLVSTYFLVSAIPYCHHNDHDSWGKSFLVVILTTLIGSILVILLAYLFVWGPAEREFIKSKFKKMFYNRLKS